VTSPYVLRRLLRDLENIQTSEIALAIPEPACNSCYVCGKSRILCEEQVILEDLDLNASASDDATRWAEWIGRQVFPGNSDWQQILKDRFCIINDDVLSFLLDTAVEVFARIRLCEDSKTVDTGGLWYEEALPAETILCGPIVARPVRASSELVFNTLSELISKPMQLGGNATVGRGLCRLSMTGGE